MKNEMIRYLLLLISLSAILSLGGCGSGSDGIQSDSDYNATQPLTPPAPVMQPFEGSITESASKGVFVGQMVLNNIASSGVIAITLSGTGNENFVIDIQGVITVASGAILDYESVDNYSLIATAIDGTGNNISATTVTITVMDVADEPSTIPILSDSVGNVVEGSTPGTSAGTITIVDSGDSPITAITLSGSGSEKFTVTPQGAISVAGGVLTAGEVYSLIAKATNGAGDSDPVIVTINVT